MTHTRIAALLASTLILTGAAQADIWQAGPQTIEGSIRAGSREGVVKPGDKTQIAGRRMTPGQTVQIMRGTELLTPEPVTVDADGKFTADINVPADAGIGLHPLTVIAANPPGTTMVDLKLSQPQPLSGEDRFALTPAPTGQRAYLSALSDDGTRLYVAAARGDAGPALVRYDTATMAEDARADIAKDAKGEAMGVYGLDVDDKTGNVWTTETLKNTLVVYGPDLKPIKIFDDEIINHPRDVVVVEQTGRVYVNAALTGKIHVFDAVTMEELPPLMLEADGGRKVLASMSLEYDPTARRLYSVSRETPFVGWVDVETGKAGSWEVEGMSGASGIDRDPETGRIYIASQNSDNLIVLSDKGEKIADTPVGAGALSVAWDGQTDRAYVASRGAGTVTVADADGKIVANLPLGELPNHVVSDGKGNAYAVAMFGAPDDGDETGSVSKITVK